MYKFLVTFCLAYFSLASAAICENSNFQSDNSSLYRLPKNVLPESYEILLLTNVTRGDFVYKGSVTVDLKVVKGTDRIIFHADKLKIINEKTIVKKVISQDILQIVRISNQYTDNERQFHSIYLADSLMPGKYTVTLNFVGEVLDDVFGFYRSSYRVNNRVRWIGLTQFSSVFARRAFPCMDEPGFKSTFQLSVGHYDNETVTSNTFVESYSATDEPNYYITRFSRTPRMPTYLLGWAIHDFHRVNSTDPRMCLWTRQNDSKTLPLNSSSVLAEGPKIYSALETWMNLSNPVHKVEQFAVPDFYFSAMENWGFITFRESVPLVWDNFTSLQKIHDNFITMAHEYAHTWFGNIVTPEFWSVAWLKEGFATYFAYLSIDIVHKDWKMMNLFPLEVLQISLVKDSEEHNRTMNGRNVGSPSSAQAAMDFVTYEKGASIIRMIADVVGEKLFKRAMRSYLKEKQYEAASPSDIYKHLESALNSSKQSINIPVPIDEFIDSWANQTNYPLVQVSRVDTGKLQVSQKPFRLNNKNIKPDSCLWWIPLKILLPSQTNENQLVEISTWLGSDKSELLNLPPNVSETSWYVLNPNQIGYYRVNYDAESWKILQKVLDSEDFRQIPSINRAALIDDAFNLARAGYETYDLPLTLIRYLVREDEYEPWIAAARAIRLIDDKLKDRTDERAAFRRYARDLITKIFKQLSFEEHPTDSRMKNMQRNLILSTACTLDLGECVSNAKSIFDNWIADENKPIPANLKSFVYRTAIVNGTDGDWINLWQRFLDTVLHSEKESMFKALAVTNNSIFINKYLDFAILPDSDIAKQYRLSMVQSIIAENIRNIEIILNYIEEKWNKIIDSREVSFLESMISAIGKEIVSETQKNQLTIFIEKNVNLPTSVLDAGKKAMKTAEQNILWINTCATQIANFFKLN